MKRFLILLALLASGCATVEYPKNASEVYGVGCDYQWDNMDMKDYCRAQSKERCTAFSIEFSGWGDTSVFKVGVEVKANKYEELLEQARKYKQLVIVSALNDNKGSGKYGDDHNHLSAYPQICSDVLSTILSHGPEGVWVQIVSETQTDYGRQLEKDWTPIFVKAGFTVINNRGSRPSNCGSYGAQQYAYHPFETSDTGSSGCIVVTDTGQFLNTVQNGGIWGNAGYNCDVVSYYANAVANSGKGNGLIIYAGFCQTQIDDDAMDAVADAFKK